MYRAVISKTFSFEGKAYVSKHVWQKTTETNLHLFPIAQGDVCKSFIRLYNHLRGHYSQCFHVHRQLNNAWYRKANSLIGQPYLAIVVGNDIQLFSLLLAFHFALEKNSANVFFTQQGICNFTVRTASQ